MTMPAHTLPSELLKPSDHYTLRCQESTFYCPDPPSNYLPPLGSLKNALRFHYFAIDTAVKDSEHAQLATQPNSPPQSTQKLVHRWINYTEEQKDNGKILRLH